MNFRIEDFALSDEEKGKVEGIFQAYAPLGHDPWGASRDALLKIIPFAKFLYQKYFRVSLRGIEKVPAGPAIFISNHGGQVPIDGLMICYSLLFAAAHPRLVRSMVERWVPSLPFVGAFFMKVGQIVGDQKNCQQLLEHGQSVLVFPEGIKGSGKTFDQRYQLQNFTSGFYRMAVESKVPIVPVVVIGTEETYPAIANLKGLANLFGAPYFPVTPTFPLLGPLGAIPLPARISLRYLDPIMPNLPAGASDREVALEIEKIHASMQEAIGEGLLQRGNHVFTGSAFGDDQQ